VTVLDRLARRLDVLLGVGPKLPAPLNCGCTRADSVIVGCLYCDHATCDNHRDKHNCEGTRHA
jgi:hypothetical protein